MFSAETIQQNSESLIELLGGQCADLEKLLSLAREETEALERQDFDRLLDIFSQRRRLGEKLDVFQRQVMEMRERLGESANHILHGSIAERISNLAQSILSQDAKTRPLLLTAQHDANTKIAQLDKTQHHSEVYTRANLRGLSYDKQF